MVLIEMQAHTKSFCVLCNGVKLDFLACVCSSVPVWPGSTELAYFQDNWLKAISGQHPSHWLLQAGWQTEGQPPILYVNWTATSHLSSCWLFLNRAQVCSHQSIQGLLRHWPLLQEIHIDAPSGKVMAGAGGAADPAPDIWHQPPGKTVIIYCNYWLYYNNTVRAEVKATHWHKHYCASPQ